MPARIYNPENLNSLEVIQVIDYMDKKYPTYHYSVTAGNGCVWVYWGSSVPVNLYFIFRDGKIIDIQVD